MKESFLICEECGADPTPDQDEFDPCNECGGELGYLMFDVHDTHEEARGLK